MKFIYLVKYQLTFLVLLISYFSSSAFADELSPTYNTKAYQSNEFILAPVVVNAEKRVKLIEDVSISLSVINEDDLKNTRANKMADMMQLVPNFNVVQYGVTNSIAIRGIGSGGRNIGFDTRVGVYLDGVYVGQVPNLELPIFDIEQIEVLRGPQGYLFGRNTVAGAVNITTRAPTDTFEAYYRTGIGNYNARQNVTSISGPISESLKGKLAISTEYHDGFVKNLYDDSHLNELNRIAARGQLSYQVNDQFKIDVSADYSKVNHSDFEGVAVTGLFDAPLVGGPNSRDKVNFNTKPYVKARLSGINLIADYGFLNDTKLSSFTSFRSTNSDVKAEIDYSPIDLVSTRFKDDYKQFSQEIRFESSAKLPSRYVTGIYLLHENANTERKAIFGRDTSTLINLPTIPVLVPFDSIFGIASGAQIPIGGSVKTDSYGVFGSFDYDVTDKLTLNLGARYTSESKDLVYSIDGSQSGNLGFANLSNYKDHRQDNDFSPMVGMTYAINKNINVYGKYSTGFKSGGWNVDFLNAAQISNDFSFDKETVESYELGMKGNALNHRIQYDIALFLSDYKDFQVFQFVDVGAGQTIIQLKNAAKAQSKGVEASVKALVTDHLNIGANIGLLDAKFKSFPGGAVGGADAAGQHLPDAPELTAAITCNYTILAPSLGGNFDLYGESTYRSKSYSALNSDQSVSGVSSRNIFNTRVSYLSNNHHWQLSAWARNLFDKKYTTARGKDFFGNQFVRYGDPRLYGLEAQYNF